jgi:hypothetical protein
MAGSRSDGHGFANDDWRRDHFRRWIPEICDQGGGLATGGGWWVGNRGGYRLVTALANIVFCAVRWLGKRTNPILPEPKKVRRNYYV